MDQLTSMQIFCQVVDSGSFALAGQRLGVSAPMVSKHVAQLEKRLGARLQQYTQVLCVGQGDKLVRGNVQDGVHGGHFKGGTGTGYTR